MEWIQILSLFLANAGLIIWFRSESRSDWRHMDMKVDAIQEEIKDFHHSLYKTDRDFRERLLKIEMEKK